MELAKQLELLDKNEFRFVWITEFPLLEWSEEQNRYVAMHHPFTMPMEEDLPLIDSDPGKVRATASLDSFLMRLNMEFRLMQDLLTVWIVSLCLWQNRTAFVM